MAVHHVFPYEFLHFHFVVLSLLLSFCLLFLSLFGESLSLSLSCPGSEGAHAAFYHGGSHNIT